jgi:preprotein translocase subunit Sss1
MNSQEISNEIEKMRAEAIKRCKDRIEESKKVISAARKPQVLEKGITQALKSLRGL